MIRKIVAAGLAFLVLAGLPAIGQEAPLHDTPELDGAPPPLKVPAAKPKSAAKPTLKPAVKPSSQRASKPSSAAQSQVKPAAGETMPKQTRNVDTGSATPRTDDPAAVKLAKQAEAQAAERARLEKQAAELKAQQENLAARVALLSAREKSLDDREADLASQKAELDRQRQELQGQVARRAAGRDDDRAAARSFSRSILDRDHAISACEQAGEVEARARSFYSAAYNRAPYFSLAETWQVRGRMRIEGRIGYKIVDTVCEIDEEGEAQRFTFLR